jgi:predicted RNA binding protein YcfA (HicA-like mRNA interferase family)
VSGSALVRITWHKTSIISFRVGHCPLYRRYSIATMYRFNGGASIKVRDAIQRLEADGWRQIAGRGKGSHRVFRHATKPGTVTVPGHPNMDLAPGTWLSIQRQAGWRG